jgi:hypothetical protein
MTRRIQQEQNANDEPKLTDAEKPRRSRRIPERYDILIQCRDEAEQRELFDRLQPLGLKLRLLVL